MPRLGVWHPSAKNRGFGTPGSVQASDFGRSRDLVPRFLPTSAIWFPRLGETPGREKPARLSRVPNPSRFAQGRVPNLGSCREKVPNRPVLPRIFLLGVPNLRSWQLPSPLGTKPAFLTGSSSAGKPLGETPEADPSCLAPTVNRNTSNACQLPMSLPKGGDNRS